MRIFLSIFFLLFCGSLAAQKTWVVKKGTALASLSSAIGMAASGDTILIQEGVYKEGNIEVNKPLYIKGIGYPRLDGNAKDEIMGIKADGVTIEGLVFQNGGHSGYLDIAALKVYGTKNVRILRNKFLNNFFGVYIQWAKHIVVEGNYIVSNASEKLQSANGIHCWRSDSLTILNNEISGHRDGIYFEFVTHSLIKGNNSHGNSRYGLHFMFSHSDTYINNIFRNNGAGVSVMYTRDVTMLNNLFAENWGNSSYGILLKDISDSHIEGNHFYRNTSGIYMEGTSRTMIIRNKFESNGWGLKIQASCDNNLIQSNNFIGNSFDVATNGSRSLNKYDKNYWDKYEGFDLNRDGIGDVPYRPVSLYSMIVERNPSTMMLFRSFMITLLDKAEKVLPGMTPENLIDEQPLMKPVKL